MRHNSYLYLFKIALNVTCSISLCPITCSATNTMHKVYTHVINTCLDSLKKQPSLTALNQIDRLSLQNKKNSPDTLTHIAHKAYPLGDDMLLSHEIFAPTESHPTTHENQEELTIPSVLIPEESPTFTPEQSPAQTTNQEEVAVTEQKKCTNSKVQALVAGCCLGSIMGAVQFKTRRFFPYNWIVGFFIRILLVEAIATPCTAPNKDLMRESAWASDWLVYGYLRLHSLYLI